MSKKQQQPHPLAADLVLTPGAALGALSILPFLLGLAGCGGGTGDGSASEPSGPPSTQEACVRLQGKTIATAAVLSTTDVAATGGAPSHCQLTARIAPKLNFVLRLPPAWNGKLYYVGGGGYNGAVPPLEQSTLALVKGFATVASDSGHQASGVDASWALNDAEAAQLFGSLSVPTVMSAAVEMIRTAYGSAPSRSYFEGCSNGGREALMNAQRYPQLFDGIIARAPAYNWTGMMGAYHRNAKAAAAPGGALNTAKVALLAKAVRDVCDAADGLADGVVSNPAICNFDPSALRCPGGSDLGNTCLSDAQLATVSSVAAPATFNGTSAVYRNAGWRLSGNEDDAGSWGPWLMGDGDPKASLQYLFQDTTVKAYLARNLGADSLLYDYASNPVALGNLAALNDATSTDLGTFRGRGGKLILWHGGSDPAISYKGSVEYYQGLITSQGGQAAVDGFARFYVAPGVNHCNGGQGPDQADLLAALDAWVDKSAPPGNLFISKVFADTVLLSRPLCRYPQYPRYVGPANDIEAAKRAENFVCTGS